MDIDESFSRVFDLGKWSRDSTSDINRQMGDKSCDQSVHEIKGCGVPVYLILLI